MKNLLLLHGAIGSASDFDPLVSVLEETFTIHRFHFRGHGGLPLSPEPFSIASFAEDVRQYLQQQQLPEACIFGYSMGGYVGMYLAKHFPGTVSRLVTLGTKFNWNEAIAAKESSMLNPDIIEQKIPVFARLLQQRHTPGQWKAVLQKTAAMLTEMGYHNPLQPDEYPAIQRPVLLLLGDRDKMVTPEETVAVYKQLPDARLGVLPATPHALELVDTVMLSFLLKRFLL